MPAATATLLYSFPRYYAVPTAARPGATGGGTNLHTETLAIKGEIPLGANRRALFFCDAETI